MGSSSSYRYLYAAYAIAVLTVASYVNDLVQMPYMDEIFHVPQARRYCKGDWNSWDPKLTTPAGLYLPSALLAHALPHRERIICSTTGLRAVNAVILLLLPLLYSSIFYHLRHPTLRPSTRGKTTPSRAAIELMDRQESKVEGLLLSLFPVSWFFGFLFYTDLASLAFVLLAYERSLNDKWLLSATFGALSLLFRQTNIIWLAFIASLAVIRRLDTRADLYDPSLKSARLVDIPLSLFSLLFTSVRNVRSIMPLLAAYLPVFIAAAAFVYQNGGIVLGDKDNHVPTLHIPQLYYFSALTAIFLSPSILSFRSLRSSTLALVGSFPRFFLSSITITLICWTIKHYTVAHPFLLADNRHYAFYVWRRIINVHPFTRYALSPGYLLATRLVYDRLVSSSTFSLLATMIYTIALGTTLIPSPLIEPRYFIIPFALLSLHLRFPSTRRDAGRRRRWIVQGSLYAAIDLAAILLFLFRPFAWPSVDDAGSSPAGGAGGGGGEMQRFMW